MRADARGSAQDWGQSGEVANRGVPRSREVSGSGNGVRDTLKIAMAERFEISLTNQQSRHAVDEARLIDAARAVLRDSEFSSAAISLAVVDDETIHELNRRHLDHDYATDVLSFVLEDDGQHLEGEVILSADTAAAAAEELGHAAAEEQLLYVIHGMLHLVGH